jgi:hypothetical protein
LLTTGLLSGLLSELAADDVDDASLDAALDELSEDALDELASLDELSDAALEDCSDEFASLDEDCSDETELAALLSEEASEEDDNDEEKLEEELLLDELAHGPSVSPWARCPGTAAIFTLIVLPWWHSVTWGRATASAWGVRVWPAVVSRMAVMPRARKMR